MKVEGKRSSKRVAWLILAVLVLLALLIPRCGKKEEKGDVVSDKGERGAEAATLNYLEGKILNFAEIGVPVDVVYQTEETLTGGFAAHDGVLRVPLRAEERGLLTVWSIDFAWMGSREIADPLAGPIELTLEKARPLEGVVLDVESGEPVAGAMVRFGFTKGGEAGPQNVARSDKEGMFAMPHPGDGALFVEARLKGKTSGEQRVDGSTGSPVKLLIGDEAPSSIRFIAPGGTTPFPLVVLLRDSSGDEFLLETDETGRVDMTGSPNGEIYRIIFPDGEWVAEAPFVEVERHVEVRLVK